MAFLHVRHLRSNFANITILIEPQRNIEAVILIAVNQIGNIPALAIDGYIHIIRQTIGIVLFLRYNRKLSLADFAQLALVITAEFRYRKNLRYLVIPVGVHRNGVRLAIAIAFPQGRNTALLAVNPHCHIITQVILICLASCRKFNAFAVEEGQRAVVIILHRGNLNLRNPVILIQLQRNHKIAVIIIPLEFAELHRVAVIGNLHIACQSVGIFLLAGFDGNLVILHIRHSAVSGVVCIHHRYNLQHIFILIQSQCYVIGGILQGSGKLADGRFLPIQSDFHIIIQIKFLFGRAILDRNLGIGDILQFIFLFSCLLDAVLGICHRNTAHILPFVGHLHSIPCFDIRKSNRLSVIFRRYLSFHPKQAQRGTACRHRQENIPVLHRLAVGHCPCCGFPVGFRSLVFHQLIIGFYGKHRHLRTGDVLLGIEFIIRIPHHQIHSVQQLQIGHCRCGNRILIGIAQCCAGFHVIALYGIHRLPENHADILAVCRLCAALQLI